MMDDQCTEQRVVTDSEPLQLHPLHDHREENVFPSAEDVLEDEEDIYEALLHKSSRSVSTPDVTRQVKQMMCDRSKDENTRSRSLSMTTTCCTSTEASSTGHVPSSLDLPVSDANENINEQQQQQQQQRDQDLTPSVAFKVLSTGTEDRCEHVTSDHPLQLTSIMINESSANENQLRDANQQEKNKENTNHEEILLLSSTSQKSDSSTAVVHTNCTTNNKPAKGQAQPLTKTVRQIKSEVRRERRILRRQSHPPIRTYWNALPVDLLERIFRQLSIKHRHIATQVCPHWFECFYSPYIWAQFKVEDGTLTKRKFNYYLGYQRMIDPFKAQAFLKRFGHTIRNLVIAPMSNFYNLFEFMKIMESYALHYEENPLVLLHSFDFTFGCQFSSAQDTPDENNNSRSSRQSHQHRRGSLNPAGGNVGTDSLIGTGGKVLEALQSLMGQLIGLKHLALRNLLLSPFEAQNLLDNALINCCERLESLTLINCSMRPYDFLHTGCFINLDTLVISCSNEYTKPYEAIPSATWKRFMKNCDLKIQVHLALVHSMGISMVKDVDISDKKLIHQPALVTSIIYDSAYIPLRAAKLLDIIELYSESIECLAFYQLPKFTIPRTYSERADAELLRLCECCPRLNTLIIRELISTATLLIIVTYARNLTRLFVRRNAIRKRFDCVRNPQWSDAFVDWLKRTSRSYDDTFVEVAKKLGYPWQPLSDEQFKKLRPDVNF